MECAGHHFAMSGRVASEFVSYQSAGRLALLLEKPAKEAGSSFCVPPRLHQDIQDLAVLIRGSISSAPAPDSLLGHFDASFRQKVFDIPKAETEAAIELNRMADDFLRKTMAMIDRLSGFHRSGVANQRLT